MDDIIIDINTSGKVVPAVPAVPETPPQKCNAIFLNLLTLANKGKDMSSSAYIREFWETARCDKVSDMEVHREEYRAFVKPSRLERILTYNETDKDEKVATQAVMHYSTWHNSELAQSLFLPDKIWYHSVSRAERGLALSKNNCIINLVTNHIL